jgi:hypothetical protein
MVPGLARRPVWGSASAMAEVGGWWRKGGRPEVHEGVGAFIGRWVTVIFEKQKSMGYTGTV